MSLLRNKWMQLAVWAPVAVYALVSLLVGQGEGLTAFGDIAQAAIQAMAVAAFLINVKVPGARPHQKAFWIFMAGGGSLWMGGQLLWTYYEVILHKDVPNPFVGDLLFFTHIVPMLAAAFLQPHATLDEGKNRMRLGRYDFIMLMVWWVFVYGFVVGPWEFIRTSLTLYGVHYNLLYLLENVLLIVALGYLWLRTKHSWKRIYGHLCGASILYTIASLAINTTIDNGVYFTGSLYDVPLVASMAWYAQIALSAYRERPESELPNCNFHASPVWQARLAVIALLSMPLLAFWTVMDHDQPASVREYRLLLTLAAMVVLILLLYFKQNMLDRNLKGLLKQSREAYDHLHHLQSQLLQTEKLASIGRLVSGAAHEINNPLTAILGFSDLLATDPKLEPAQREMAEKVLQQARRTQTLVSNLLTFAKQSPAQMKPLDLNAVVANALQLRSLNLENGKIKIIKRLDPQRLMVWGDQNHLLQLCVHILSNAVDAMSSEGQGGTLTVCTQASGTNAMLTCADTGPGISDPARVFDPFYTTKEIGQGTGLGLSASYGIVRNHGGNITCSNRKEGGAVFTISIPLVETAGDSERSYSGDLVAAN